MAKTVSRRQARRSAFVLCYQHDLRPDEPLDELCAQHERDAGIAIDPYTREAIEGIIGGKVELDQEIDRAATGWTSDRLGAVERAVLRLGIWELWQRQVPAAIVIDEAVELAKRFASPEAAPVINGLLGTVAKDGA